MQNKRTILIMGILILVVGAAAFVGGRMLNNKVNPLGLFGLGGRGNVMVRVDMIPAKELPTTAPEAMGQFVERKDNTIFIQSISLKAGGGGVVVAKGAGGPAGGSSSENSGPKIEVVITNETTIYRDTTQPGKPTTSGSQTVQQTVEESTLDQLNSQSMVQVWGRKSGDRIIADVLFYSNPVFFKRQGP
ncbi:MAG TPA: hypothetical protein VK249_09790 [Anaerolineales bacterium]|nr:hypothetical protein [Anaerolineales bacterium]